MTSDADIRIPLLAWLRSQHPDHLTAKILEEFKMPRPSARIDVALVNGEMSGFEIKSDRDTLNRLAVQMPAFSRLFDRMNLVTTRKHLAEALSKIPSWWGVVVFRDDGSFEVLRTSQRNRKIDVAALLFALSKRELALVAGAAGVAMPSAAKKGIMVDLLAARTRRADVCSLAREVIKSRVACL